LSHFLSHDKVAAGQVFQEVIAVEPASGLPQLPQPGAARARADGNQMPVLGPGIWPAPDERE
jgi:hypothetical protein